MPAKMIRNADGVTVFLTSCDVCGKLAHWGFAQKWACFEHRQLVEAEWVAQAMNQTAGER